MTNKKDFIFTVTLDYREDADSKSIRYSTGSVHSLDADDVLCKAWLEAGHIECYVAPRDKSTGANELEEIRNENEALKKENEALKKPSRGRPKATTNNIVVSDNSKGE